MADRDRAEPAGLSMSLDDMASRGKRKREDERKGERGGGWQGERGGGWQGYGGKHYGGGSSDNRHYRGQQQHYRHDNRDKRPRDHGWSRGGGHGKAAAAAAYVPPPKVAGEQLDEEGHLWFDAATDVCTYFQDRRRKWPFYTGAQGKEHLVALVRANATLRKRNRQLLEQAGEPDRVAREGERLYVEKPTLRGDANVTWS